MEAVLSLSPPLEDDELQIDVLPNLISARSRFGDEPQFEFLTLDTDETRLTLRTEDNGLTEAAFEVEDLVIEADDAVIGLYSAGFGSFGSTLVFGETDDAGGLFNKWAITRRTTPATGELQFAFGTNSN